MSSGDAEAGKTALEKLYDAKFAKLAEQKRVASTYHTHLSGPVRAAPVAAPCGLG